MPRASKILLPGALLVAELLGAVMVVALGCGTSDAPRAGNSEPQASSCALAMDGARAAWRAHDRALEALGERIARDDLEALDELQASRWHAQRVLAAFAGTDRDAVSRELNDVSCTIDPGVRETQREIGVGTTSAQVPAPRAETERVLRECGLYPGGRDDPSEVDAYCYGWLWDNFEGAMARAPVRR